jgi:hypothetical protein
MQHWFVYYRLGAAEAQQLAPRLRRMLDEVAAATGVRTQLMRRADAAGGEVTLLEVYQGVGEPQSFEAQLAGAIARAGLPQSLRAQRRSERFEAVDG